MKIADVHIGQTYVMGTPAAVAADPEGAGRVRVVGRESGKVTVLVELKPGSSDRAAQLPVGTRRGDTVGIPAVKLLCEWGEADPGVVAAVERRMDCDAELDRVWDQDRVQLGIDPMRRVDDAERRFPDDSLRRRLDATAVRQSDPGIDVIRLRQAFSLVPAAVYADIISAGQDPVPATEDYLQYRVLEPVARDVFAEAWRTAQRYATERFPTVQLWHSVQAADREFVAACLPDPPVDPFVPRQVDSSVGVCEIRRDPLGWLPLAFTNFGQSHAPSCTYARADRPGEEDRIQFAPLWALRDEGGCGTCRGPAVPVTPEWVAFRAASDQFAATRAEPCEWQRAAVRRLLTWAREAQVRYDDHISVVAGVLDALCGDRATGARFPDWPTARWLDHREPRPGAEQLELLAARLRTVAAAQPPTARVVTAVELLDGDANDLRRAHDILLPGVSRNLVGPALFGHLAAREPVAAH